MRSLGNRPHPAPVAADWARCEAIARAHGRTFYLASRCLSPAARRAALATYAFCRIADDIVDGASERGSATAAVELARWTAQVERPDHPVALAFAETRACYGVPVQPVYDLLTGIGMDLKPRRYATWTDLRGYCYHVAGTVGLMVAPILGCRDPHALTYAATLGIAMQLTNILRDVAEDARRGRLYLPLDELAAFDCDPEAILAGRPDGRFSDLIAFQIERARSLYADAALGIPALGPSGRLTTLMASRLYAGILTEIEALDYDVFRTRARVSGPRKARALPGIAACFVRLSLTGDRTSPAPQAEYRTYG
jgi:phytoene synthase